MKLFDTATKQSVDFTPPQTVRLYTCGITPYDSAHLGHIFTFMTYDLLQRYLEDQGHSVHLVRNVTDVDEPIFKKAKELGIAYTQLAEEETTSFQETLTALHFRPAYAEPKASEYIDEMASAVKQLIESDYAYRLEDDIYFDVSKDESFGTFSGFSDDLQLAFMKRRGGDPERPGKRQPLDFLLWRGITDPDDPAAWDSPVGRGRPGWHIECSVMADTLLGTPFDIHGGGTDLIFPHHECEIAQSKALGKPELASLWMHVAPISYLGEKMSKSLGNLIFAKDLLGSYEPAAIRLALMHYDYRTGGEWLPDLLDDATILLSLIRAAGDMASKRCAEKLLDDIRAALADDLDTHAINHLLEDFASSPCQDDESHDGAERLNYALNLLGIS
jgi:L-cysteine:1D-myo-inositol 2-amino-2-deoxy-alpha-D-glucopyranoside ligase